MPYSDITLILNMFKNMAETLLLVSAAAAVAAAAVGWAGSILAAIHLH